MIIKSIAILALCGWTGLAAAPDKPKASLTLKSVTVTLPSGEDVYPGGKSAEAINNNCLACHSTKMVLNQPTLSKATWTEEVTKMRKVYGAPVAEQDVPAIVDYLARLHPSD